MDIDRGIDSAQKAEKVLDALESGKLKLRPQDRFWADQLRVLPRGITGLLNISKLTPDALAIIRATALALTHLEQAEKKVDDESPLPILDAQCMLFRLYEELFVALTGVPSGKVGSEQEIKSRMLARFGDGNIAHFDEINAAAGELEQFYRENSASMFRAGKSLGGIKVVSGGQRRYGPSALSATRIAGLYCDTQLIPDPVWPFFAENLHLNALHLQLAIALFYILPLRPLVDARLSVPPILVFPSFEERLEANDAMTQAGIASLAVKVIVPACNANMSTIDELFEYVKKYEQPFLDAITRERLFVPPGVEPTAVGTAEEAAAIYLQELKGVRDQEMLGKMEKLPRGVLVLNGILERLRPQYHLAENAEELNSQPMLSTPVHWYYFELCAQAEARELIKQQVLSREAFDILRALQDDSLTWLGNVPIAGLVELRERMEHAELREQLKKITTQLTAAGPAELEAVAREVRHGLDLLIQRQKKAIKDIEDKYSPKYWAAGTGSVIGIAAGASMFFMPALAAAAGVSAPIASVVGAIGGGGIAMAKDAVGQFVEKRRARKSMLGILATARATSK
ncbi:MULTISPECIES: hypothetical protein [Burkholderia]|uniref:hypothetical protein n=1 Tax=Burkholderia TaxID=32008 RepID=UPI00035B9F4A|nr:MULTISPECIES: hypothetical protein [Burkholderia]AGR71146.1 hypothetical protein BDL_1423 [Burkholderia pseudomallei MSHR305]AHK64073.1 hypothetical protein BBX_3371 [Burkholderia pseudomallei MSHR520]AIO95005.1 hypothetical protein DP50_3436 [Burkholderia pseudomallei 576]AIP79903.1 hypothetical protein JE55_2207 [Burkholderia pseudomallei]AJX87827.1 hypothetical protein BH02_2685 [Burkholderia pseudomallei]